MELSGNIDEIKFVTAAIEPFSDIYRFKCPKCRARLGRVMIWSRMLRGKHAGSLASWSWCPGNKPPSEDFNLGSVLGKGTFNNLCAGIERPHLHVLCNCCNYKFLMECAS